ncbi:MAG: hypothetical protein ABGW50_05410 [Thermococcus sp.]
MWKLEQYNGHFVFPGLSGAAVFAKSPGGRRVQIWIEWAEAMHLCEELEALNRKLKKLDELAKAELEAHPEKYFSVFQEDEEGQVWVPLEEVYEAVMTARHEVKESAGVEEY